MLRLLWRMAYPLCLIANKCGASYKWVNVGYGAWHPELFDELWHWEWYGTPIKAMPSSVNLGGHHWKVNCHEGLVQFIDEDFMCRPFHFERDPHDVHAHLWRLHCDGPAWASTVDYAYRWVQAVFGGSFEKK